MVVVERRCDPQDRYDAELVLPFLLRQKSRLRTQLDSGEELGLFLERGARLRDGDLLLANDGRVIRVRAQAEPVYRVSFASNAQQLLARAAYHLGNRHVALEIGDGWLRLARDHVLKDLLESLGASVAEESAPFEPEGGAYASHAHRAEATVAADRGEP